MLHVENLTCGGLHEISFRVDAGEAVAVVGSQGSGKTTLIRALCGLAPLAGGAVQIGGKPLTDRAVPALLGVASESLGLFARMTARENLLYFTRLRGLPDSRALEGLKAVDLLAQMDTRAERLRPGELARLRLARALLHDPAVLLLDEPIGDIDKESQDVIRFVIDEAGGRGKAVLMTSFGHPRVLELAQRVLYLEEGRLVTPVVAEAPAKEATASAHLNHIAARRDERVLLYAPADIRYAFVQEKRAFIQTADGPAAVSLSMAELEERLILHGFFRCHRGYLVNVAWVKEIASWTRDAFSLILKDGTEVPLSKHRAATLKEMLGL